MTHKDLKVGDTLIAIDACYMDDNMNNPTLTVGKHYEVVDVYEEQFSVNDDCGHDHYFGIFDDEFFKEGLRKPQTPWETKMTKNIAHNNKKIAKLQAKIKKLEKENDKYSKRY